MEKLRVMLMCGAEVPTFVLEELRHVKAMYPNETQARHRNRMAEFCRAHSVGRQTLSERHPTCDLKGALAHEATHKLARTGTVNGSTKYIGLKKFEGGAVQLASVLVVEVDTDRAWTILATIEEGDGQECVSERILYLDEFDEPGWSGFCARKVEADE